MPAEAFDSYLAALADVITPGNDWRLEPVGVLVSRCPLDLENDPWDRITVDYARLIERTSSAVSDVIRMAIGA